jgi:hypothetical protein
MTSIQQWEVLLIEQLLDLRQSQENENLAFEKLLKTIHLWSDEQKRIPIADYQAWIDLRIYTDLQVERFESHLRESPLDMHEERRKSKPDD